MWFACVRSIVYLCVSKGLGFYPWPYRPRRDGRVVECGGLEIRCTVGYRGFESLSLRKEASK